VGYGPILSRHQTFFLVKDLLAVGRGAFASCEIAFGRDTSRRNPALSDVVSLGSKTRAQVIARARKVTPNQTAKTIRPKRGH